MRNIRPARSRQIFIAFAALAAIGYFAVHAAQGRHGFYARQVLIERAELIASEISKLDAVRARLARDVALLDIEKPNSDLVEELAADLLGFVRPGDRPVLTAVPAAR